ncbi:MAG: cobalamin-binding protein [Gemmatimonadales bacterium]|nr:MAG: cobalamin-binding protein [Gemmatimonadales bacterium]
MDPAPSSIRREDPLAIPHRIASLLPSATEIVCALGLDDRLVLRSHECDYPEWVGELPFATQPRIRVEQSGGEIDRDLRELLRQGLSIYEVDPGTLVEVAPELIVTQDQCRVCAVPLATIEEAARDHLGEGVRIVSLSPGSLHDVLADMERVAVAAGVPARGVALTARLRDEMAELEARVREVGSVSPRPAPRVLFIEWVEPLMVGGNWIPELVAMAGGEALLGEAGRHSPFVEWDRMKASDPDVIVVVPCGFPLERTREEAEALRRLPGWAELRAVREGRVALADGHHYFNRPGPRIVDSLRILVEMLHPELRPARPEGWCWMAPLP